MQAIQSSDQPLPGANHTPDRGRSTPPWLELIREAVEAADFGSIQIKVHAGEVVQIEATRKIRIPSVANKFPLHPTAPAEDQLPRL